MGAEVVIKREKEHTKEHSGYKGRRQLCAKYVSFLDLY